MRRKQTMKHSIICSVIVLSVAASAPARTVELTLHAAKASEATKQYTLLPRADQQTDTDAAPLYEKAIQSLPGTIPMEDINQWLKTPPEKLPQEKVQAILQQLEPTMELLDRAARCTKCDWPYLDDDTLSENLRQHRRLLFFLALKVRVQIAQSRYDDAIGTVQTALAMARHLGDDPGLMRGLVGIGVAAYMCGQLEVFIQRPDAPTLYPALRNVPRPFIDLTEQAQWEESDIKARVHSLMNRLDRHVAILQCIEAMRLYAATHEGRFPKQLSEITRVLVPDDPVTHKPFIYSRTGSEAILEGPAPEGAQAREAFRYELHLKE
jgi:tetratricopeptide (TPR) repeat protein